METITTNKAQDNDNLKTALVALNTRLNISAVNYRESSEKAGEAIGKFFVQALRPSSTLLRGILRVAEGVADVFDAGCATWKQVAQAMAAAEMTMTATKDAEGALTVEQLTQLGEALAPVAAEDAVETASESK